MVTNTTLLLKSLIGLVAAKDKVSVTNTDLLLKSLVAAKDTLW